MNRKLRRALKHPKGDFPGMKLDVWTLEKRERPVETRSFEQDGIGFTLSLRVPNAAELSQGNEISRRLIETHVTGTADRPPIPFPGGIVLTDTFCLLMAMFFVMQAPASP